MEQYGDIHLHQSEYPDFPGTYTYDGKCRYSSYDHKLYDNVENGIPLGMNKCHVEYCHPGSWQSKCGKVKNYHSDTDTDSCNGGVFGDEAVGNYGKYSMHEKQPHYAIMKPQMKHDNYMESYKVLLWLFVLLVGILLFKNIWTRMRA